MSLSLNFNTVPELVIDNTHEVFAGTAYADSEFSIAARPLARSKVLEIQRRHTKLKRGVPEADEGAIIAEIFDKQVTGWKGIVDENGAELECSSEIKRKIALGVNWQLAMLITNAVNEAQTMKVEQSEEEQKN